jgi:hypothetical protein
MKYDQRQIDNVEGYKIYIELPYPSITILPSFQIASNKT